LQLNVRVSFGCKLAPWTNDAARQGKASRAEGRDDRVRGGAIDCTVRNLSGTGAALDVSSPVGIPDHFTLSVQVDGTHLACTVVWRKEKRIGVRFG
jgi:hypothetical protein